MGSGKNPYRTGFIDSLNGVYAQKGITETAEIKALRESENVEGYYTAMAAQGNGYALRALVVIRNEWISFDAFMMSSANWSLKATAAINFVDIDMQDVRVRLMNARQIADCHFDVFRSIGLPVATFGGTPLTGTLWETAVWRVIYDWCVGCDTK